MGVQSPDFRKRPRSAAVVSQELRHDGKLSIRVDGPVGPIVAVRAETVWVLVASAVIAIVALSTEGAGAGVGSGDVAGVGCERCGGGIGFPEVHFVSAGSVCAV